MIGEDGITVVGKGKWGMLYGVQTVNQLVRGTETLAGHLADEHEPALSHDQGLAGHEVALPVAAR